MCDRYYSDMPILDGPIVLSGPEAHHLIHVMRAKPGTRVVVFDGRGGEFLAEVRRVGRAEVELAVHERRAKDRELSLKISLAVALPKGDRQKWLVEKAVELGIATIVPLVTTRSVARPDDHALGRLRRTVIEASKQCGRNRLLEISPPQPLGDYLYFAPERSRRLIAHPHRTGNPHASGASELCDRSIPADRIDKTDKVDKTHRVDSAILAIGPEGGFTEEEFAAATTNGWQAVDLGPRILRVETAAILLAAMLIAEDHALTLPCATTSQKQ